MLARPEWNALPTVAAPKMARAGLAGLMLMWRDRLRDRDQLAAFTERDLRDIGLTRADMLAEVAKPFWRA